MIIKKKYATINKESTRKSIPEQEPSEEDFSLNMDDTVETAVNDSENTEENEEFSQEDDFNLDLDSIKFESRQERREGTRRRGYRRSHDRNIVTRAQEDAIALKETAKNEGYKEGLEKAKQDIEELKNNFSEFFNYKDKVYEKVTSCITDVAVEIASKILNKEVEADKEYIFPIIKKVLEEINKTENKIILKVKPQDVEIVKDKVGEIFSGDFFEAKISIVADKDIKDGGVKVETSNGIIDATIETQLAIIEKALKKQEEG